MNSNQLLPLIVTSKLEETKGFYRDILGWSVVTDQPVYLEVAASQSRDAPRLCFLHPDQGHTAFAGQGLVVSIPTASADQAAAAVEKKGQALTSPATDRPWGWRSFQVTDPNGVLLDIFHVVAENAMTQDATG